MANVITGGLSPNELMAQVKKERLELAREGLLEVPIVEEIDEAEQARRDKLEAFDAQMRLTRRLDEVKRDRDKVFKDAATQLKEAKELYKALQNSKDLLGMEKAKLNQKYVQTLSKLATYEKCLRHEQDTNEAYYTTIRDLQDRFEDGKRVLLAACFAAIIFTVIAYFLR